MNNNIMQSIV
jgi:hypothetical protein